MWRAPCRTSFKNSLRIFDWSHHCSFLSQLAFNTMTSHDIEKCFLKHDTYIKTLRFVSLPPALTNLDLVFTEYLESGEVLERTTRAWAGSLLSPDGSTSARCDTVNGGTDKRTSLSSGPSFPSSLHSGSSLSLPTPTQSYWQARSTISRKVSQAFLK